MNANSRKAILVTGSSSGIGRATALALDAQGYRVFAGIRRETDARALTDAASPRLRPVPLDVTDPGQIDAVLAAIDAEGAPLHGVVNNAGFNLNGAVEFTDEARARALMETNLFGLAAVTRAALPRLRATARSTGETAKIVNVGSIGSLIGIPWEAWYHASKFAVLGFSESLRTEVHAQGVRVSVVCPGGIRTPFIAKSREGMAAAVAAMPPEGRALYGAGLAAMGDVSGQVDRWGSPPEAVARRIARLLARRDPPFRVLVGPDAALMAAARAVLPARALHAILCRTFGG